MKIISIFSIIFSLFITVSQAIGISFTLSDEALMCLDYPTDLSNRGTVTGQRNIPGPGVEFDIYLSKNEFPENSCFYLGSIFSGIDVSMYDNYDLQFSLVSVDGITTGSIDESLVVGSYIGKPGRHRSEWLDFGQRTISSTYLGSLGNPQFDLNLHEIDYIGFWINLYGDRWSDSGNDITVLIEAAPGCVAIVPEPTTLILLGFGALILLRKRKL